MPDDEVECPRCGRTFSSRERMVRHSESAHGVAPRSPLVKKAVWLVGLLAIAAVVAGLVLNAPQPTTGREANMERYGANDDPHLGNESAPVVVVEFAAPSCPSCRHFHENQFPGIRADYIETGDVVLYMSQYTINRRFDRWGSYAQECVFEGAGDEAYFAFTDRIYEKQGHLDKDNVDDELRDFARANGHDGDALVACYENGDTRDAYEADLQAGRDVGVPGTPAFFVFGDEGSATTASAPELRDTIEAHLEGAGGS